MTLPNQNPLARGFHNITVTRLVILADRDDSSIHYLPLHPSQQQRDSSELIGELGLYSEQYAVVEDTELSYQITEYCNKDCLISQAVYRVEGQHLNKPGTTLHLGDFYSAEEAQQLIDNITFANGIYGQCWEINSCHITRVDNSFLRGACLMQQDFSGHLFELFKFPVNQRPCIGIKLMATPWIDSQLSTELQITYNDLCNRHKSLGLSDSFIELLHRAGKAGVRILIIDPEAARIDSLPIYSR